jgi:protein-tyrosine phosphatase
MTICPGKKGESVYGAAWDRDLATDLDAIEAWGAECVVTLMEDFEFAMLGIPDFPSVMAAQSFEWLHLEIRDADVPDHRFESAWPLAREKLLAVLERGGRVLVHCRGGLGRTGLMVARLLVEQGMAAEEAIRLTRSVRQGAIETKAQERHVLALVPLT